MLGYIQISRYAMNKEDFETYRGRCCSICKEIGLKYGQSYRFLFSYDVAFIALLLEEAVKVEEYRDFYCTPFRHIQTRISPEVIEYCAFLNQWLMATKLQDDLADEKSIIKHQLAGKIIRDREYRKVLAVYKDALNPAHRIMEKIFQKERENAPVEDLLDLFGNFFGKIIETFYEIQIGKRVKPQILEMVYWLGQWIYLIDAYEDLEKDRKHKVYNLLQDIADEEIDYGVYLYHQELKKRMESCLSGLRHESVLRNIIGQGCEDTYQRIWKKKLALKHKE